MAQKYRVKLASGRVVGPIELNDVAKLCKNGHLSLEDSFQEFPSGDWQSLENLDGLQALMSREELPEKDDDATVMRSNLLKDLKEESQQENEEYREFKFSIEKKEKIVTYDELEENFKNLSEQKEKDKENEEKTETQIGDSESSLSLDKTVVVRRPSEEEIDKTVINSAAALARQLEEEKLQKEKEREEEERLTKEEEEEEEVDLLNEETKMVDLKDYRKIGKEFRDSEKEIALIEDKEKEDNATKSILLEGEEDSEDNKPKKKKMTPIVAFTFIVLLYFLFVDEDEKKKFEPQFAKLSAPITLEVASPKKALVLYEKGLALYKKGNYLNRVKAANLFKQSVENNIENNKALGMLVLSYSELIKNSSDIKRASRTLFNLIKITRSKVYKDINVAMGTALFYKHMNKIQTSLNILENYLRLSKPSLKFLGIYLDCAIEAGDLILANKIYKKVASYPNKPLEIFLALSKYHSLDEMYDEGEKVIQNGLKLYSSSVLLMLELASYKLRKEDIKSYTKILRQIEKVNYESNPLFYAKYLEYVALLSALNRDNEKAAILFKTALKISKSEDLRAKLAGLDIGGGRISENLILESKAIDFVRRSKKLVRQKRWREAFHAALSATNLGLTYLPADLNLIKLQIKRGYYEFSIEKLEQLKSDFPENALVKFYLIEAKTKANKLSEAQMDVSYATTALSQHPLYYPIVGRFYEKSRKYVLAIRYLGKSVQVNPLRSEDYFEMAKIYMKNRQYKDAKAKLSDALNLDPLNTEYISFYSKIIYELDGAETAIGYLRDKLKEHVDDPLLMGDIASYYYNSGQLAKFEDAKKDVVDLNADDENFYRFLIQAARIEDDQDGIIKNSEKLLLNNPGDLESRMLLSRYYAKKGEYKKSLEEIDEILGRLSSYPKAYYLKAKVYIEMKQYKNALAMAEKETKANPNIYNGWYIRGEVFRLMKDYKRAVKSLEKAISLEPKSVDTLKSLGWIKLNQRHYDIARELYLRAKKRANDDPEIRKQLGFIYKGIGQGALAIEEFQTYLKLYPNAPDLRAIKQQINSLRR